MCGGDVVVLRANGEVVVEWLNRDCSWVDMTAMVVVVRLVAKNSDSGCV